MKTLRVTIFSVRGQQMSETVDYDPDDDQDGEAMAKDLAIGMLNRLGSLYPGDMIYVSKDE